jgi:hypothetical protein
MNFFLSEFNYSVEKKTLYCKHITVYIAKRVEDSLISLDI